jgi:hypothetical protein
VTGPKISCPTGKRNLITKLKKEEDEINKEKKTFLQLEALFSLDLKLN